MKRMRICFLANVESIHNQRWIKYFVNKGYDVHVISFKSFGSKKIKNVKLHQVKLQPKIFPKMISSFLTRLYMIMTIRKLIKKIKPDIINSQYLTHYGFLGALSGFHPFVATAWGSDVLVDSKKSSIKKLIVKYAIDKADLITCDAKHMKETLIKFGKPPQNVVIVNFGIDTKKFKPLKKDDKIKKELHVSNSPLIISLRSLEPIYDIETLIKSVPLVLKKIPNTKFLIAGGGSQEKYLKQLANLLGVSDSIRFLGIVPNDKLPQYLSTSDVYVSTSLSDGGIAASTAEAMACGLTVVITDFGDNRKWVKDGVNGFIIPAKDPKTLAKKIVYLLKNKDIKRKFGERNRQIIEERNNYYKEMEKMNSIYKELIERRKI